MKQTKIEDLPQMLTAQHIADYLIIARNTVYDLFKLPPDRGGIPNFNIGKSRRVMKSDLVSWIQSQRTQQDTDAKRRIEYIETGVRSVS